TPNELEVDDFVLARSRREREGGPNRLGLAQRPRSQVRLQLVHGTAVLPRPVPHVEGFEQIERVRASYRVVQELLLEELVEGSFRIWSKQREAAVPEARTRRANQSLR